MTRLQKELSGQLGEFWQRHAEKEVAEAKRQFETEMTVDDNGVVRNCIGRVIMDDMAEKLEVAGCIFDREATRIAKDEEDTETIRAYKEARANHKPTEEEMFEMRAAFGAGATVVDVLTGQTYEF